MNQRILKDPATFEIFVNAISGIADEMAITILRTAHSQIVAETMDFSAAICDAKGRVVAQANTLPVHLGSVPAAMEAVFRRFGDSFGPDDIYILNDPDEGGMHLPDIFVIMPVFHKQQLVGFTVSVANHADVGGAIPGSMGVQASTIFAEGIQIPPVIFIKDGVRDDTLLEVILRNVREPEYVLGDLESQLAACHTGKRGLEELIAQHGADGLRRLMEELLDYSEVLFREVLRATPDGVYEFEDCLDDDGKGSDPVPIRVRAEISGDSLTFDFTGTAPQVPSALNATVSFTQSSTYAVLQAAVGGTIPANAGFYRPIEFVIPKGTILNPNRPAARGARGLTGCRLLDTVMGALAPVFPDRIPAAGEGGPDGIMVATAETGGRSAAVLWDVVCGSWGARPDRDGIDGTSPLGGNIANTPVEELERSHVIRIDGYGYLSDSGGPGKWRGGLAVYRDMTLLADEATLNIRSDRRIFQPYGLKGGCSGTPSANLLNPGPEETLLPSKPNLTIRLGDRHRHVTAGAGGYGESFDRDPAHVLEDVIDGKVTIEGAARDYGVVIGEQLCLDEQATAELRSQQRSETSHHYSAAIKGESRS